MLQPVSMTQTPILRLAQVTKQFLKSETPAVCNADITLSQGNILGLLGPSGCGKTTLLRLIAGFEHPQTGYIEVAGRRVADGASWVAPEDRSIGMVFQDFALFPHLTVLENVAFGLRQTRQSKSLVAERVAEAIALVQLQGKEQRYPHELSGGQQQRVALARALAPRPSLILLDEPLSNLDLQVRLYLRQEVRDILKATGTSGVFVTHDQEEALSICDQVAVMRQGQIEQLGTPEEIYWHPASRFVAEFVTQANFLPARRCGHGWETEIGFLPNDTHCTCKADGINVADLPLGDLMIRQEDMRLEPDAEGQVVVRDRHFLGREYRYCLQTPSGRELHAQTPMNVVVPIGTTLRLSVPHPALTFFPVEYSGSIGKKHEFVN